MAWIIDDPTPILGMTVFHDAVYVATGRGVYRIRETGGLHEVSRVELLP